MPDNKELAERLETTFSRYTFGRELTVYDAICLERDLRAAAARIREMEWRPIESAPRDGTPFLVWEVVICDELDEDDNVIARNQRHERAVIAEWLWGSLAEPSGRMCPSNGRWDYWTQLPAAPSPPEAGNG